MVVGNMRGTMFVTGPSPLSAYIFSYPRLNFRFVLAQKRLAADKGGCTQMVHNTGGRRPCLVAIAVACHGRIRSSHDVEASVNVGQNSWHSVVLRLQAVVYERIT